MTRATVPSARRTRRRRAALAIPLGALLVGTFGCSLDGEPDIDPLRDGQWALDALGLPAAHGQATGCGATIAIVDSGVDLDHPDLQARLVDGIDLVDGDDRPDEPNGHGTHVAGIAAAAAGNGTGIVGAAPCASIMPVRVLDTDGGGDDDVIASGIRFAADQGAGCPRCRRRRPRRRNYRPAVPVIVVGAIGPDGAPAEFSNFGDPRTLVAPGAEILSASRSLMFATSAIVHPQK